MKSKPFLDQFGCITGFYARPSYRTKAREDHPVAARVFDAIEAATGDLRNVSGHELGSLSRVGASLVQAATHEIYRRIGHPLIRLGDLSMRTMKKCPFLDKDVWTVKYHFADHIFLRKIDERLVWIVEPYHLSVDDMPELIALEKAGWSVSVCGSGNYFPGRTVCIEVERADVLARWSDRQRKSA